MDMLVATVCLLWASSCDGNALRKERIGRLAVLIDKVLNVGGLSNSLLLTNIHEKHNINTHTYSMNRSDKRCIVC